MPLVKLVLSVMSNKTVGGLFVVTNTIDNDKWL